MALVQICLKHFLTNPYLLLARNLPPSVLGLQGLGWLIMKHLLSQAVGAEFYHCYFLYLLLPSHLGQVPKPRASPHTLLMEKGEPLNIQWH